MKKYKANIPKLLMYLDENKIEYTKGMSTIVVELHENVGIFINTEKRSWYGQNLEWCEDKSISISFDNWDLEEKAEVTIRLDFIIDMAMNGIFIEMGC